ncbi:membrane protein [Paenibacillus stellifer]|uniref:Membrane protein n=2 Tax=Paenibacillus stellifer TaxID=169760 RepID=A0A089LZW0_9BACL|nr:stage II sporulation protein M [Paenibacillus stellifer]AIQ65690.1 membrane protein [Paenibacillus stellifer]
MFSIYSFGRSLAGIRRALLISVSLFILGIVAGWIGTGSLERLLMQQIEGLGGISRELRNSSNPQLSFFIFIFLNNSIKGVLIIFLGALFGILPALFLLINGAVIGYLIHASLLQGVNIVTLIVKGLLPHGIIEIPAIIIACAFGLNFGARVARSLFRRRSREDEWADFLRQTLTVSVWIVLLLLAAAVIESTITFNLMS